MDDVFVSVVAIDFYLENIPYMEYIWRIKLSLCSSVDDKMLKRNKKPITFHAFKNFVKAIDR